jgi:hypothetical protein
MKLIDQSSEPRRRSAGQSVYVSKAVQLVSCSVNSVDA